MKSTAKIVYLCKMGWTVNTLLTWKWCIKVKTAKTKIIWEKDIGAVGFILVNLTSYHWSSKEITQTCLHEIF